MDIVLNLVKAGKSLFSYLTWSRIAMLAALLIMTGVTMAFWDNRPIIYKTISAGKFSSGLIPLLSETTKTSINSVVDKHPNIVAVQVVETDFRNNTRDTKYFYSDEAELAEDYKKFRLARIGDTALFAAGDTLANERLISIIEQDFTCVDMPARLQQLMPSAARYAKQVCSISVPPRYGKMVGYINLWLKQPIDRNDVPLYRHIARSLSDEVYDRDVMGIIPK